MSVQRLRAALSVAIVSSLGCGSSGHATPDVATVADAAGDAPAADAPADSGPPQPIVAPDDEWTWIDFPDSKCAAGTPTGIGVNPHAGATSLLIYFEGGGACTDATTCWGASPGATHLAGYDATTFAAAPQRAYPILDRALAGNPLAATNLVYVPYCTGDLHSGTAEVTMEVDGAAMPTYFWGARDLEAFLARLVPTFAATTTHVWVLGTSAGGEGTYLTFDQVARAFDQRVDIIDDSGPPLLPNGATGDVSPGLAVWGFVPPAACSPCTSLPDVFAFDRQRQPNSKFAFLSFDEDTVISVRLGYTLAEYPGVMASFSSSLASDAQAATYLVSNEQAHVVESDSTLATDYLPWLTLMVNDDPSWADATYAHP